MFFKKRKKQSNQQIGDRGRYKVLDTYTSSKNENGEHHVGPVFSAIPPSMDVITDYAYDPYAETVNDRFYGDDDLLEATYGDSSPVSRELRISLSESDWSKFEKQPFYSQLIEWVHSLENCDTRYKTDQPEELQD